MEAPEKIYLRHNHKGDIGAGWLIFPLKNNDIEYTRTDAFVEKACEWIREFNNHHYIMRYSDSCEPPLSELTEWFKNYMKGE
jgi:hypothetical protein